jgi:C-terminal processing protease CtpA/Prc
MLLGIWKDFARQRVGDVIVAIDNHSISKMTITRLRQLFRQDGSEHQLRMKRDHERLAIKLQVMKLR